MHPELIRTKRRHLIVVGCWNARKVGLTQKELFEACECARSTVARDVEYLKKRGVIKWRWGEASKSEDGRAKYHFPGDKHPGFIDPEWRPDR